MTSILMFLFVGMIAGWLSGLITGGRGFGIVGDVIVGVLGAIVGGRILGWLGIFSYGMLGSLVAAVTGAVILLSLIRVVKRA